MLNPSGYRVTVEQARPRLIAAVTARVRKGQVPAVFGQYLDRVYAAGNSGAVSLDGQNIFVYRPVAGVPDHLDVDFGVGVKANFSAVDGIACASVPGGRVATTTHWGNYGKLRVAHDAVQAWIRDNGVRYTGVSWEVY